MTIETLIALLIASFVVKLVPGPGVFATAGHSIANGFSSALCFIGGAMLGDLLYIIAVLLGLAVIAREFNDVFFAIRVLGGGYLIYLGIKVFRAANTPVTAQEGRSVDKGKAFLNGLVLTLGNPKVILFYVGLMPAFIDIAVLTSTDIAILCLVLTIDLGCILAAYAYAADRARKLFTSSKAAKRMNQGAGAVLTGSGLAVITSS